MEDLQPVQPTRRPRQPFGSGCFRILLRAAVGFFGGAAVVIAALSVLSAVFPPPRLNILLLGLDQRPGETSAARTDTMIVATIDPNRRYVGMLSIPRDLWVTLPDGSPNRINTAHFYAEAASPGTGPAAAAETVSLSSACCPHSSPLARMESTGVSSKVRWFNHTPLLAERRCNCRWGSGSTLYCWKYSGSSETFM